MNFKHNASRARGVASWTLSDLRFDNKVWASLGHPTITRILAIVTILSLIFMLAACAQQPAPSGYSSPGFFSGLFHGLFLIGSAVGSIFLDIRIYSFPNTGFWYDIGFVIGAIPGVLIPLLLFSS